MHGEKIVWKEPVLAGVRSVFQFYFCSSSFSSLVLKQYLFYLFFIILFAFSWLSLNAHRTVYEGFQSENERFPCISFHTLLALRIIILSLKEDQTTKYRVCSCICSDVVCVCSFFISAHARTLL